MSPFEQNQAENQGCGHRLRSAREAAGLSLAEVAGRLRMPVHVVEALETEQWQRLGAPVFVRGQLRSYLRLLGLPTDGVPSMPATAPPESIVLVPRTRTSRARRIADQVGGRLVYIVITALIVLPVWVATRSHIDTGFADTSPLDLPAGNLAADVAAKPSAPLHRDPAPVVASMASMASMTPRPAPAAALSLSLDSSSWVQVTAPDGSVVEEALLKAGDKRSYAAGAVGRMVLGNAAAAEIQHNGVVQDLSPFLRANVARFTVSSDGSLAPVAD